MKKRTLSLFLAIVLTLSLCACGDKSEAAQAPDLGAFYETLFTGSDAPAMMALDDDLLESLYPGLTDIPRAQTVAYTAAISSIPAEVVLIEVENDSDVSKVGEILRARISYQVDEHGAWYPETIEGWQNHSEIITEGRCIALFVADNKDAMVESFRAQF